MKFEENDDEKTPIQGNLHNSNGLVDITPEFSEQGESYNQGEGAVHGAFHNGGRAALSILGLNPSAKAEDYDMRQASQKCSGS